MKLRTLRAIARATAAFNLVMAVFNLVSWCTFGSVLNLFGCLLAAATWLWATERNRRFRCRHCLGTGLMIDTEGNAWPCFMGCKP